MNHTLLKVLVLLFFSSLYLESTKAQNCLITPAATSVETANDGTLCSYEITLCVEVPVSPSPKRIYFNIDYDSNGDGSLDASSSFEIDPPGNADISAGTYCHTFSLVDVVCDGIVDSSAIGYVGNGDGSDCASFTNTGTTSSISLPVDLLHFEVRGDKGEHLFSWATASEENTMLFILEQSNNGMDRFVEIGRVDATGNSVRRRDYSYRHRPSSTHNYYRLRIIDFDGYTEFSDLVYIRSNHISKNALEIYPNPVHDQVNIQIDQIEKVSVVVQLTNLLGSVLRRVQISTADAPVNLTWDLEGLPRGLYQITIDDGETITSKKLLKTE